MKTTTYRNKIEALMGITPADAQSFATTSAPHKQRRKQRARWNAHLARKNNT